MHTNCSALSLKLVQKGDSTHDNVCQGEESDKLDQQCGIGVYIIIIKKANNEIPHEFAAGTQ